MQILFQNKKLEKLVKDNSRIFKELVQRRAKLLLIRLQALIVAETLEDVRYFPGNFHELTSERKGQWACDLDQPYRLIFEPHEKPIPANESGQYIWLEIKGVEIIEITNYHGK